MFFLMIRRPPRSTLFPLHDALPISAFFPLYPLLVRFGTAGGGGPALWGVLISLVAALFALFFVYRIAEKLFEDRKSTRLNSSHANISYAVFCLKKKMISTHTLISCY